MSTFSTMVQGLLRESVSTSPGTHAPCSVLSGVQDRSHQATYPKAILRDAPQAKILLFDDCGHFPDLEDPQRFAQILLAPLFDANAQIEIANSVQDSFKLKTESECLPEVPKRAVEIAIEEDEAAGMACLKGNS